MAYTREKPRAVDTGALRQRIPGWGVDLDPAVRPSGQKERFEETGAHWDFPERRPELTPRERSTEHRFLTPVFGTAQPLKGLSALAAGRPDNPITESGVLRELKGGAFRTRFGQHRADLKHQPVDILIWAAPYVAIGVGVYLAGRALSARRAAA